MYIKDKNKYIGVRLSDSTFKMLYIYSKKMNMSISGFIRFILDSYLISLKEKI